MHETSEGPGLRRHVYATDAEIHTHTLSLSLSLRVACSPWTPPQRYSAQATVQCSSVPRLRRSSEDRAVRCSASGAVHTFDMGARRDGGTGARCEGAARHLGRRPPSSAMSSSTRPGSALHRPSTFKERLMSATTVFSRCPYSAGVSSHGRAGTHRASLYRHHPTAVSWSMSSCNSPGWRDASSPSGSSSEL